MIERIINRYLEDLQRLRENAVEFDRYEFKWSVDRKRDENQLNRLRIGVGLLNDLKIPDDYDIVKRLIHEEVKHRGAGHLVLLIVTAKDTRNSRKHISDLLNH